MGGQNSKGKYTLPGGKPYSRRHEQDEGSSVDRVNNDRDDTCESSRGSSGSSTENTQLVQFLEDDANLEHSMTGLPGEEVPDLQQHHDKFAIQHQTIFKPPISVDLTQSLHYQQDFKQSSDEKLANPEQMLHDSKTNIISNESSSDGASNSGATVETSFSNNQESALQTTHPELQSDFSFITSETCEHSAQDKIHHSSYKTGEMVRYRRGESPGFITSQNLEFHFDQNKESKMKIPLQYNMRQKAYQGNFKQTSDQGSESKDDEKYALPYTTYENIYKKRVTNKKEDNRITKDEAAEIENHDHAHLTIFSNIMFLPDKSKGASPKRYGPKRLGSVFEEQIDDEKSSVQSFEGNEIHRSTTDTIDDEHTLTAEAPEQGEQSFSHQKQSGNTGEEMQFIDDHFGLFTGVEATGISKDFQTKGSNVAIEGSQSRPSFKLAMISRDNTEPILKTIIITTDKHHLEHSPISVERCANISEVTQLPRAETMNLDGNKLKLCLDTQTIENDKTGDTELCPLCMEQSDICICLFPSSLAKTVMSVTDCIYKVPLSFQRFLKFGSKEIDWSLLKSKQALFAKEMRSLKTDIVTDNRVIFEFKFPPHKGLDAKEYFHWNSFIKHENSVKTVKLNEVSLNRNEDNFDERCSFKEMKIQRSGSIDSNRQMIINDFDDCSDSDELSGEAFLAKSTPCYLERQMEGTASSTDSVYYPHSVPKGLVEKNTTSESGNEIESELSISSDNQIRENGYIDETEGDKNDSKSYDENCNIPATMDAKSINEHFSELGVIGMCADIAQTMHIDKELPLDSEQNESIVTVVNDSQKHSTDNQHFEFYRTKENSDDLGCAVQSEVVEVCTLEKQDELRLTDEDENVIKIISSNMENRDLLRLRKFLKRTKTSFEDDNRRIELSDEYETLDSISNKISTMVLDDISEDANLPDIPSKSSMQGHLIIQTPDQHSNEYSDRDLLSIIRRHEPDSLISRLLGRRSITDKLSSDLLPDGLLERPCVRHDIFLDKFLQRERFRQLERSTNATSDFASSFYDSGGQNIDISTLNDSERKQENLEEESIQRQLGAENLSDSDSTYIPSESSSRTDSPIIQDDYEEYDEEQPESIVLNEMWNPVLQEQKANCLKNTILPNESRCTILCIDASESMQGEPWKQVKEFVNDFASGLEKTKREESIEEFVAMVSFGSETKIWLFPTNNYHRLCSAIEQIKPGANTPLLPGLAISLLFESTFKELGCKACRLHELRVKHRIILVSDGRPSPTLLVSETDDLSAESYQEACQEALTSLEDWKLPQRNVFIDCVQVGETTSVNCLQSIGELTQGRLLFPSDVQLLVNSTHNHYKAAQVSHQLFSLKTEEVDIEQFKSLVQTLYPDTHEADLKEMVALVESAHLELTSKRTTGSCEGDEQFERFDGGLPVVGLRVEMGPDIPQQYVGILSERGTVTGHSRRHNGKVYVHWDSGANTLSTCGPEVFEVLPASDKPCQYDVTDDVKVGCTVRRGPDWTYGNEDGGADQLGTVCGVGKDGIVNVRWQNGIRGNYRYNENNAYDVLLSDPADPFGIQSYEAGMNKRNKQTNNN